MGFGLQQLRKKNIQGDSGMHSCCEARLVRERTGWEPPQVSANCHVLAVSALRRSLPHMQKCRKTLSAGCHPVKSSGLPVLWLHCHNQNASMLRSCPVTSTSIMPERCAGHNLRRPNSSLTALWKTTRPKKNRMNITKERYAKPIVPK